MKNKTMIITLAAVLMISFALAPSAEAIVAPLLVAIPVAAVLGTWFKAISKHVAANEENNKIVKETQAKTAPEPVLSFQTTVQPAK